MLSASVRPGDPYPGARLSGFGNRMNDRFKMKRLPERRHGIAPFGNRRQELMNLYHLQIVEPELMAGGRNELPVRG